MATGYAGSYRATVLDNSDPLQDNRLLVAVPEIFGADPVWAVASLTSTSATLPSVGDPVWVSFEHGDSDYPVWQLDEGGQYGGDTNRRYAGKYRGVVVDVDDPYGEHRLRVRVPEVSDSDAWAPPGPHVDLEQTPEVGSEVWIEYDEGDPEYPRWVGLA